MFDRIAGVYDLMNSVMTAGLHHPWRRARRRPGGGRAGRPRARRRDRHRRPGDRAGAPRRARRRSDRRRTSRRRCSRRAREKAPGDRASSGATRWSCPTPTTRSTRQRSASARATSPTSTAACARWRAWSGRAAASWSWRSRRRTRPPLSTFYRLWFDRVVPAARQLAGDSHAYELPAQLRQALPGARAAWPARWTRAGLERHPLDPHRRRHHRASTSARSR